MGLLRISRWRCAHACSHTRNMQYCVRASYRARSWNLDSAKAVTGLDAWHKCKQLQPCSWSGGGLTLPHFSPQGSPPLSAPRPRGTTYPSVIKAIPIKRSTRLVARRHRLTQALRVVGPKEDAPQGRSGTCFSCARATPPFGGGRPRADAEEP